MSKLVTIGIVSLWLKLKHLFYNYYNRVIGDSGEVEDNNIVLETYSKLPAQSSIEFAWLGGAGSKKRTFGIYSFFTKLYDMFGTNDATQTTESKQPYVAGNIAPNEVECMKNPNKDARYIAHPEISFATDETWSISFVIYWNGTDQQFCFIIPNTTGANGIGIKYTNNRFFIRDPNSSYIIGTANQANLLIGKTKTISFIYNTTNVAIYIDGTFFETLNYAGAYNFSSFFGRYYDYEFMGQWKAHIIRSIALTPDQVATEHTLLRSIYPEIPSVKIGTQEWATSNLEMVATPMGNVIPNITEGSNVEKVINGGFDTAENWLVSAQSSISGGTANIISTDGSYQYISQPSILTEGKWYKMTFDIVSNNSGAIKSSSIGLPATMSVGSHIHYGIAITVSLSIERNSGTTDVEIDNVSVEQVGWAGLNDLYTWLIAEGYTEADAVKECAAWCYYNNDSEISAVYGKLYNWPAVKLLQNDIDAFNLANPTAYWGWHVPTQAEFETLATALGGAEVAGGKMKVAGTDYWNSPNTGADNSSGFSALGGGFRSGSSGIFGGIINECRLRVTTELDSSAYYVDLSASDSNMEVLTAVKTNAYSLRLIKDSE